MPITVDVPDVGVVEFPDGMKPEDINSEIEKSFPHLKQQEAQPEGGAPLEIPPEAKISPEQWRRAMAGENIFAPADPHANETAGQIAKRVFEETSQPIVKLPELKPGGAIPSVLSRIIAPGLTAIAPETTPKIITGAANEALGMAQFMESPMGLTTMGAGAVGGPILRTALGLGFGTQMAKSGAQKLGEGTVEKDPTKITEGVIELGGAPFVAAHSATRMAPGEPPPITGELPRYSTGETLNTPKGAVPPERIPANAPIIGTPDILNKIIANKATKPVSVQRIFPQLKLTEQQAQSLLDQATKLKGAQDAATKRQIEESSQPEYPGTAPRTDIPADSPEVRQGESAEAINRDSAARSGNEQIPETPKEIAPTETPKPSEVLTPEEEAAAKAEIDALNEGAPREEPPRAPDVAATLTPDTSKALSESATAKPEPVLPASEPALTAEEISKGTRYDADLQAQEATKPGELAQSPPMTESDVSHATKFADQLKDGDRITDTDEITWQVEINKRGNVSMEQIGKDGKPTGLVKTILRNGKYDKEGLEILSRSKKNKAAAQEQATTAAKAVPAPESDTVRLYRGHDGSPGGVYYTEDKTYASQQGPEMEYLDVPRSELSKYGVQQVEGSGTPKAYKLPPEMTKAAKPLEKPPTQPVYDLEADIAEEQPKPVSQPAKAAAPVPKETVLNPEAVSDMPPAQFVKTLRENGKQPTQAAYELGKTIASPEQRARIAELESKAAEESKKAVSKIAEAKTDAERSKAFSEAQDANAKKQYFNEAGRLYDAIQEANKTGDRAAAAKKFGVDEKAMPEVQKPGKKETTQTPKPTEESDQGELIPVGDLGPSMGAMTPSDPLELASKESGNPDVYGIAQRVREARAAAGQVAPVEPGQGVSAPDAIERGRELLRAGNDAEQALRGFEQSRALNAEGIALVRARGEQLAQEARQIEQQRGTDSPEYREAYRRLSEWDKRSKPMQTEWHKIGMAQQGETDLDTGSFTGLQRGYEESTGKRFTPDQEEGAKKRAKAVKDAEEESLDANGKLGQSILTDVAKSEAERRAQRAVWDVLRKKAVREANQETKARVSQLERAMATADEQIKAAQQAERAASKTVRDAAARAAREENLKRIEQAQRDKAVAQEQIKAAKKAESAIAKQKLRNAIRQAQQARKDLANPEQVVWRKVQEYIEGDPSSTNISFDELRTKVATDLGMPVKQVTALMLRNKRTAVLANDAWLKQQRLREAKARAKGWLYAQSIPGWENAMSKLPAWMFRAKVGFHGTVALGTHAPMVAFQPRFWGEYVHNFARMYRMIGSPAFYEMQVQELLRNKNYITARRAGLVNDPFQYEEFTTPAMKGMIGRLSGMGNRGYAVLKFIRQDMFDQMWEKLPKTAQNADVAKGLADGINHATGVTKTAPPRGSNLLFFAPRLLMSRAAWLAVDPAKAAKTMLNWKNATEGQKRFALNQVQEKAWVVGTLGTLLAINQAMLNLTGSTQKVNLTDPTRSDFLKFKIAGMNVSYGNPMLTMARLPVRMYQIRSSDGGKTRNLVYPDETTYGALGTYARSQMSPFASLVSSLWFRSDYQNRPLPGSTRDVPKRLRAQGYGPYTWPEFWSEQFLPIPFEEGAREVWHAMGINKADAATARKALATISIMGATGMRLNEDTETPTILQKAAQFQKAAEVGGPGTSQSVIDYMLHGHEPQARRELGELLKTKKPAEIVRGIEQSANRSLTGSMESELKFFQTLTPEEKQQYREERKKRIEGAKKSIQLLRDVLAEQKKHATVAP